MKITCPHCKSEMDECPHCGEEIEQKLTLPLVLLLAGLILSVVAGLRWQGRLDEHEEAMRKRAIYIKSNPDAIRLPISN